MQLRRVFVRSIATLTNRNQVLPAIDKLIGKSGNTIEYIYTRPDWSSFATLNAHVFTKIGSQSAGNPYGHACARFRYGNNDVVMNISRPNPKPDGKGEKLANFLEPVDYFFSPPGVGNVQGGIFNRGFITVRIDDVETEDIAKMHRFYEELQKRNDAGKADFRLLFAMVNRTLARWFPSVFGGQAQERGNCAYWTSQGLVQAGVLPGLSHWPAVVLFKLMLAELDRDPKATRVNVISYRSLKHNQEPQGALLYPFHWLRHSYKPFWSLDQLATIIVDPKLESPAQTATAGSFAVPSERYTLAVSTQPEAKERWQRLHREMVRVDAFTKDTEKKL